MYACGLSHQINPICNTPVCLFKKEIWKDLHELNNVTRTISSKDSWEKGKISLQGHVQYRSEISGLRTRKTHAQFLRKRLLKNACLNTRLRACFLLLFTLVYGILLLLLSTKGKTKGSSNKHHWKYLRRQTNSQYLLGHAHGVGVQSLVIDKRPTVTQIFLFWTECKRKQSQPSILCYISLCRCCLSLLSFAGLARNKEKNLHNALKFSCTAELFQSQTVQSLQCLRGSRCLISQCKSCQIFRFYRSFSFYQSGWRKQCI